MIKALPWTAILAAGTLASLPAVAQQDAYDGTYEYAAPGWRGLLEIETAEDGTSYFAINTRGDGAGCSLLGAGRLSENTITLGDPGGSGSLVLRFFDSNAEIEASGSTAEFCDAGARLAGVYIQTEESVALDRDDVRMAQTQLNKLGYDAGAVDGIAGRRTSAALSDFQRRTGLPATGELSLSALYRLDREVDQATSNAAGRPAGTGEIAASGAAPVAAEEAEEIDWMTEVPRSRIPVLDGLYSEDVPARIDWANPPFEIAVLDLDRAPAAGPDQEEILVFWNDVNFCSDQGCTFEVLRAGNGTYAPVLQTVATEVGLGADYDGGLRRLIADGEPWVWDGDSYVQDVYQPTRVR